MAICDLSAMGGLLAPEARLMGLDLGAKTIGVAVSDVSRTIATARTTIRRTRLSRDIETLRAMIAADGIGGIVVGLPVNMDGSEGPRAQSARDTAARLADALALPVAFWDERLSTVGASAPCSTPISRGASGRGSSTRWPRPTSCRARSTACARGSYLNSRMAPRCTTRLASRTMAKPGTIISGGAGLPSARSSRSTIAGSA